LTVAEPVSVFAARLPAEPQTINCVHDQLERLWLAADHVPLPDRMAFDLAVIETVTNTIRHCVGDPGPVEVGVELTAAPLELLATITEYGAATPGVDSTVSPGAGDEVMDGAQQHLAESGRGLALIQTLVSLGFEREGTTNVWRLRRRTNVPV
jgi:serine/threonine-protein kinase RsbW